MGNMLNYNKGTGCIPSVCDNVVILHTNSEMDSYLGMISGWVTPDHQIAIVTLDTPLSTGESTICMPVVCLDLYTKFN